MKPKGLLNFVKAMPLFVAISIALCAFFIGLVIYQINAQTMNIGIDFAGGLEVQILINGTDVEDGEVRNATPANIDVQRGQSEDPTKTMFYLRMKGSAAEPALYNDAIRQLNETFGEENITVESNSVISGTVSNENLLNAGLLVLVSWVLILLYIAVRFEMRFGVATIVGVIHDVVIALGVAVLCGVEMNTLILSATLTLIGYSTNDSIVLFDRVRENLKTHPELDYKTALNLSINQTLTRTLNTSVSTILAVVALLIFGSEVTFGFALTLLVGMIAGVYSTMFIAAPFTQLWNRKKREKKAGAPVKA